MVSMLSGKPVRALPGLSGVSQELRLKQFICWSFGVFVVQGRDGEISLALRQQVLTQASQHLPHLRRKPLVMVAVPVSLSARPFPLNPTCLGQYLHSVLRKWTSNIETYASLGVPFHCYFLFAASLLSLWGWRHTWPDSHCQFLRHSNADCLTASSGCWSHLA